MARSDIFRQIIFFTPRSFRTNWASEIGWNFYFFPAFLSLWLLFVGNWGRDSTGIAFFAPAALAPNNFENWRRETMEIFEALTHILLSCLLKLIEKFFWNQNDLERPKPVSAGAPAPSGVTKGQFFKVFLIPLSLELYSMYFWNLHDLSEFKTGVSRCTCSVKCHQVHMSSQTLN